MDVDSAANYRLISNLNTFSKVLEKLFSSRLGKHVQSSSNINVFQSAYKKNHSTETSLLKIWDGKKVTILVSLDLSAAFDSIDHSTLLQRLEHMFGVFRAALRLAFNISRGQIAIHKDR